jgi:predicted small secreted protein
MEKPMKMMSAVVMMAVVLGLTACKEEGPAEGLGRDLDNALQDAGNAIEDAADEIRDAAADDDR